MAGGFEYEKLAAALMPQIKNAVEEAIDCKLQDEIKTLKDLLRDVENYTTFLVNGSKISLRGQSDRVRSNEKLVMEVARHRPEEIKHASEVLKNNEDIAIAAVTGRSDGDVAAVMRVLPDEMKNHEKVALLAVEADPRNFGCISTELRNNEKVAVAAVAGFKKFDKDYLFESIDAVMRYLPDEMKNNEKVAYAFVDYAWNGGGIWDYDVEELMEKYLAKEITNRIFDVMKDFECAPTDAARSLAEPFVLNACLSLPNCVGGTEQKMIVACTDVAGNTVATLDLEPDASPCVLRQQAATTLGVPPPVLHIVLPSGKQLREIDPQVPLCDFLRPT